MKSSADKPPLKQSQSSLILPNNIDRYAPVFISFLNHFPHQYRSSEECFNSNKEQILKLCLYQNLSQTKLSMQSADSPSMSQVLHLFGVDVFYVITQAKNDSLLSGAEINQIVELVRNQINIIQNSFNLSDYQSQKLQAFCSARIQKFIEFQIDETNHLSFHNPNDFQRFTIFQLNYLNTFMDFMFNNFNLFTEYLTGNFQLLFVDFDMRIQIMMSIQYVDFLGIRQTIEEINSNDTNYNFGDETTI